MFWGLNPHYDAGALQEKIVASSYHVEEPPGTWYSYAQFYLNYPFSASAPWPGSLPWAIHSRYYYNLGTITGTLKDKQFTLLKDKYDEAVDPSQKRLQAFWDIAKDYGIMAAEYLPMHSRKTVTRTLGPGSSVTKQVQAYHTTLLQTIMQVLEPDGWIVAMGNPCTRAVRQLLSQNGTLTKMQHVNGAIVLETWTPRDSTSSFKVSFGPFIGTAGGALNSTAAVENWLGHMLAY
ncbi:MAG: hypothetical protein C7B44_08890 [Sulfobacillus thermosulfidooxidans]|nr:MAG: hypothetical protein C7B44_08890 [Sulfobacillus thermosulfidooxidans]